LRALGRERYNPRRTHQEDAVEKRLTCECGHEIAVRADSQATSLDCPACGREIPIPAGHAPEAPTAAPAPDAPEPAEPPPAVGGAREPCPFCLELILPGARKCPYCQEYLDAAIAPRPKPIRDVRPQPRTSSLAVGSLALGILAPFVCFLTAVPAILMGIAGIAATRERHVRGRGMAIVGLLLGLLWTVGVCGLYFLASRSGGMPIDVGPPENPYLF
jgi:hypothetical protein